MRMRGHAIHDPADYVPQELLDLWAQRDPLALFERSLRERSLLDDTRGDEIDTRIRQEIDDAVAWAEASDWPDPGTLEDGVYAG